MVAAQTRGDELLQAAEWLAEGFLRLHGRDKSEIYTIDNVRWGPYSAEFTPPALFQRRSSGQRPAAYGASRVRSLCLPGP